MLKIKVDFFFLVFMLKQKNSMSYSDGIPLLILAVIPPAGLLRCLLPCVSGAQGLVLLGAEYVVWFPAHIR